MIEAMLKSAVILAVAACVAAILRRQSAAIRHAIWAAGLMGAMAIPICTLALPSWQTALGNRVITSIQHVAGSLVGFRGIALTIWLAGAGIGLLLLFYGAARLGWVAMHSEPVEDQRWMALAEDVRRRLGIRRPVRLLQNRSVPFLGTWGIMVPRVLLPPDAESWSDDRIRMVLGHELAHIQRHDWVVQVLADAARAIYWFNPIFWIASSRLRRESEHACDDAVVRMGASGTTYAEELVEMTRALRREVRTQSPILAMAQPSHLEQRLVALLNPSLNRLAATPWAVIVVSGAAIALTAPLASVRSHETPVDVKLPNPTPTASTTAPLASAYTPLSLPALSEPTPTSQRNVAQDPPAPAQEHPQPSPESAIAAVEPVAAPAPALQPARTPEPVPAPAIVDIPHVSQPFDCRVTPSVRQTKETMEKMSLGYGPWVINEDRTIWAAEQPYVARKEVNTIWMKPANTDLVITGRRLDAEAPPLSAGTPVAYRAPYTAIGMTFPEPGCWEVSATAGDSKLTFITRVQE
jgi:beta-lactamase regulating signal transducer with metallopeptidase domain